MSVQSKKLECISFLLLVLTDEHAKKPGSLPNEEHSSLPATAISKYQACGQGIMR
jgi:hypothetical protein